MWKDGLKMSNPASWRAQFPALSGQMNGKPIVFLDSGASAQKPQVVLDKVMDTLSGHYANIHRGLYEYSQKTTAEFEAVRGKVARFLKANSENEIVFTRNSTEAINLVAYAWGQHYLHADDEVLLTEMEHHANLVPWHLLRDMTGIVIKYIPVTPTGELDLEKLDSLLTKKTKLVSFVHISNALGTVNPAAEIVKRVKAFNPDIKILIDGSQSAVHMPIDVQALGADWFVFTGHKLYGPTGVGVLWGKYDVLKKMRPYQGGGDMIERVRLTGILYRDPPHRFEAGTPAIVEVIGLGAAIDFVESIGWAAITAHEEKLSKMLYNRLSARNDLRIIGTSQNRAGIVSFLMQGVASADVGMILDKCGVAVRTGHHCCQPLLDCFGIEGTIRASLALYSNENDIDVLEEGLDKARKLLS
jgi:cysteine desulfurase/selenocysteine lyase